jgi:hypothetical protein
MKYNTLRLAHYTRGTQLGLRRLDVVSGQWVSALAPYFVEELSGAECDFWLLQHTELTLLHQQWRALSHFLVPSYAETIGGEVPQVWQEGKEYYIVLRSPYSHRGDIEKALTFYLKLQKEQPTWEFDSHPNFFEEYGIFSQALATQQWEVAEATLKKIQEHNLTTRENQRFLFLRLNALQHRWWVIWEHQDYPLWARMTLPKAIRSILIQAFHETVLRQNEDLGRFYDNAAEVGRHLPRLSTLVSTRDGLTEPAVIRTFAYVYAFQREKDGLEQLRSVAEDELTQSCIEQLLQDVVAPKNVNSGEQARKALMGNQYDVAYHHARNVEDALERVGLLLEIVALQDEPDASKMQEALKAYDELDASQRQSRKLARDADAVRERLDKAQGDISSWEMWFEILHHNAEDKRLDYSYKKLAVEQAPIDWSAESISRLVDNLISIGDSISSKPFVREAFKLFSEQLLQDSFPRTEGYDLYDMMWGLLLEETFNSERFALVIQYTGALLRQDKARVRNCFERLKTWLGKPSQAFDAQFFEALETLIDYGLEKAIAADWAMEWTASWHATPQNWEMWQPLLEWLEIPNVERFASTQQEAVPQEDAVAQLPSGFRIAIFTHRTQSATRAVEILQARNPSLVLEVLDDDKMNDRMGSSARNANIAVIVTSCLSHAVFYGIKPLLAQDPVYPPSSGSVGIVRAVEDYAERVVAVR